MKIKWYCHATFLSKGDGRHPITGRLHLAFAAAET